MQEMGSGATDGLFRSDVQPHRTRERVDFVVDICDTEFGLEAPLRQTEAALADTSHAINSRINPRGDTVVTTVNTSPDGSRCRGGSAPPPPPAGRSPSRGASSSRLREGRAARPTNKRPRLAKCATASRDGLAAVTSHKRT